MHVYTSTEDELWKLRHNNQFSYRLGTKKAG